MEVAGSLKMRDRMPVTDALLLWLRHNIEVEAATRGLDRTVLSYDTVMGDPMQRYSGCWVCLGPIAPPDGGDRHGRRPRRRSAATCAITESARSSPPCSRPPARWASTAHAALGALEGDERDAAARATLDRVHAAKCDDNSRRARRPDRLFHRAPCGGPDRMPGCSSNNATTRTEKGRCLRPGTRSRVWLSSTRRRFLPGPRRKCRSH